MLGMALFLLVLASVVTYYTPDRYYVPTALFLALAFLGCGQAGGLSFADMGLGPRSVLSGAIWGGAIFAVVGLAYGAGIHIPHLEPAFADKRSQEASGRQIASKALIDVPLGTVILEELAFRGVVFGLVAQWWSQTRGGSGTTAAIAISSLLFGLWHVLPSLSMHESHAMSEKLGHGHRGRVLAVLGTVVATGLAGVGFALLRVWSGSLLAPMGLHWALNSFGSVAAWWVGRRARHRAAATARHAERERMRRQGELHRERRHRERRQQERAAAAQAPEPGITDRSGAAQTVGEQPWDEDYAI